MVRAHWHICLLFTCILLSVESAESAGQAKHLLTPQSCTSIRYLAVDDLSARSPMAESPDHTTLAYVVQAPNIATNSNDIALYLVRTDDSDEGSRVPILTNHRIAGIRWLPDNRHIAALVEKDGKSVLALIDATNGSIEVLSDLDESIADYAMDRKGDLFAVSVQVTAPKSKDATANAELETGYRVVPLPPDYLGTRPRREIHIIRETSDGHWKTGSRLEFTSPLSGKRFASLEVGGEMELGLSPDGRYLLMDNIEVSNGLPKSWYGDPYGSFMMRNAGFVIVSYLYDMTSHRVSVPLQSVIERGHAVWSPDSRSFARVALPPIGSKWVKEDMQKDVANDHNTHLFTVDVTTGHVWEVLHRAEREPLMWTEAGELVLRKRDGLIRIFERDGEEWKEKSAFPIPLPGLPSDGPLITDGTRFFGGYQNASTPPQVFEYKKDTNNVAIFAKLDPQVEGFILPRIEPIHWDTSSGYNVDGILLLPPDYDPARRYPLVIENGSILYNGEFVCDSGMNHVSSFARGILADDGVLYLMRSWPGIEHPERDYYPKGYPGQIAEAVFRMDIVESALRYLEERNLIDPAHIGILGFSRGGWYTEFTLAHSQVRFEAASVTDNTEYNSGAYWYYHSPFYMEGDDTMYGGPPYGKTLTNWLDYSISFNADKIHTPLLKEVMGYGVEDNDPRRLPNNLAVHYELFTALQRLNKPIEMYYYPEEEHQVDHPAARVASLQRNIDWFRFWLQGYKRTNPEDRDQYVRWERMRQGCDGVMSGTASSPPEPCASNSAEKRDRSSSLYP